MSAIQMVNIIRKFYRYKNKIQNEYDDHNKIKNHFPYEPKFGEHQCP